MKEIGTILLWIFGCSLTIVILLIITTAILDEISGGYYNLYKVIYNISYFLLFVCVLSLAFFMGILLSL